MISKKKARNVLAAWKIRFYDRLLTGFNFAAGFCSIAAWGGAELSVIPSSVAGVGIPVLVGAGILRTAYLSIPEFYMNPEEAVGKRIEVEQLSSILADLKIVGLLGRSNVGKTTFIDAVTHNREPKRRTARPYAVVVRNLHLETEYIALLDSVGERDQSQYMILGQSDVVCLFLDHADNDYSGKISKKRLDSQKGLIQQLCKEANIGKKIPMIIVGNKADLRSGTPALVSEFSRFVEKNASEISEIGCFDRVVAFDSHSNRLSADVSNLIGAIFDVSRKA